MHFLVMFALIGVCLIVAPVVIEATVVVVFGLLGLFAFALGVVVIAEIGWWSLLGLIPPALFAALYYLDQYLRHRRVAQQEQAAERMRRDAERDLAQRVERATAIFRAAH